MGCCVRKLENKYRVVQRKLTIFGGFLGMKKKYFPKSFYLFDGGGSNLYFERYNFLKLVL